MLAPKGSIIVRDHMRVDTARGVTRGALRLLKFSRRKLQVFRTTIGMMFSFGEEFNLANAQDKIFDFGGEFGEEDARVESEGGGNRFFGNDDYAEFYTTDEDFGVGQCGQDQECMESPVTADHEILDEFAFDMTSPSFQICFGDNADVGGVADAATAAEKYDSNNPFPTASLELLNSFRKVKLGVTCNPTPIPPEDEGQMLSVEGIVKVAGAKFIQMCSLDIDPLPELEVLLNLSDQESRDVELVELLLFSAEKVHYQQFDRASKLLGQLSDLCSKDGNPIERLVHHFAEGLLERIDREMGRMSNKDYSRKRMFAHPGDMKRTMNCIAYHLGTPFSQVAQFTGVQAITDNLSNAERIHVIDLQIGSGVQWTVLMQDLASRHNRNVELLKITAVGMSKNHLVDGTGNRLMRFAESMNIPFKFRVVVVKDMLDLRKEHFALGLKETVMIYSQFFLRTLIPQPDRLEALMKVIWSISPRRMVVIEVEANLNSQAFGNRFIDCLFFHGALFDCLEGCMDKETRMSIESMFFVPAIKNMLATEGEERKYRNVTVDVWKAYFSRFRMGEVELSKAALYQARLVTEKFRCGKFCTLDSKGKSLIVGWKGTPFQSISVFGFA